jgi:hypothetical protein
MMRKNTPPSNMPEDRRIMRDDMAIPKKNGRDNTPIDTMNKIPAKAP